MSRLAPLAEAKPTQSSVADRLARVQAMKERSGPDTRLLPRAPGQTGPTAPQTRPGQGA